MVVLEASGLKVQQPINRDILENVSPLVGSNYPGAHSCATSPSGRQRCFVETWEEVMKKPCVTGGAGARD